MLSNDEESLAQFLESEILSEVLLRISWLSRFRCANCGRGLIVWFPSQDAGEADEPEAKRARLGGGREDDAGKTTDNNASSCSCRAGSVVARRIETGIFSKLPPELFPHILKFLSSEVWNLPANFLFLYYFGKMLARPNHQMLWRLWCATFLLQDLMACSMVCKFLSLAASDESLWRRLWAFIIRSSKRSICLYHSILFFYASWPLKFLSALQILYLKCLNTINLCECTYDLHSPYHMLCLINAHCSYCIRWGLLSSGNKMRQCAWKKLYIQVVNRHVRQSAYELILLNWKNSWEETTFSWILQVPHFTVRCSTVLLTLSCICLLFAAWWRRHDRTHQDLPAWV